MIEQLKRRGLVRTAAFLLGGGLVGFLVSYAYIAVGVT